MWDNWEGDEGDGGLGSDGYPWNGNEITMSGDLLCRYDDMCRAGMKGN